MALNQLKFDQLETGSVYPITASYALNSSGGGGGTTSINTNTTGITAATTTTVATAGTSGTNANLPPYYALCYIMKT